MAPITFKDVTRNALQVDGDQNTLIDVGTAQAPGRELQSIHGALASDLRAAAGDPSIVTIGPNHLISSVSVETIQVLPIDKVVQTFNVANEAVIFFQPKGEMFMHPSSVHPDQFSDSKGNWLYSVHSDANDALGKLVTQLGVAARDRIADYSARLVTGDWNDDAVFKQLSGLGISADQLVPWLPFVKAKFEQLKYQDKINKAVLPPDRTVGLAPPATMPINKRQV